MLTALDAPTEALDKFEQPFVAKIREHGWFDTAVSEDAEGPGFSYSTGIWVTAGQPEIIMFGLQKIAHDVLWSLFRDAVAGVALPLGQRTDQVFGNTAAYVFPVTKRLYPHHLGWSRWFYAGDDFPCVQIVWPDPGGAFPWETGFNPAFLNSQIDLTDRGWLASLAN